MAPFIDIHTHKTGKSPDGIFQLGNVIVSKEYMSDTRCSVGIHPWYIDHDTPRQFAVLSSYAQKPQVIAIGECGLDKLHGAPMQLQTGTFERQIDLANDLNKPLIIHCVRAYQEVLALLKNKKVQVPVLFHGFTKGRQLAEQIVGEGYYVSLGNNILKGHQDDTIFSLPMDRIFFETDDKPILIADIYTYFCRVRNLGLTALKQQILQNFSTIFDTDYLR